MFLKLNFHNFLTVCYSYTPVRVQYLSYHPVTFFDSPTHCLHMFQLVHTTSYNKIIIKVDQPSYSNIEHTLFNKITLYQCHITSSLATVVMTTLSVLFLILMIHHHLVVA